MIDRLTRVYALLLLIIFGGIVLHAPFTVGVGTVFPEYAVVIKSWKELLMMFALLLATWLVWKRGNWREFAKDRILQVAALYAGLHLLFALAMIQGPLATAAGLAIDLRYVMFFVLVYILLKLAPNYKSSFLKVGLVGAVIVIGFGVLQLFLPADILSHIGYNENTIQPYLTVDQNPEYVRVNSTLRGPNPLGAYAVIVIGILAAAIVRRRLALGQARATLLVGVGVLSTLAVLWASYSRSAALAAVLTGGVVVAVAARHFISRRLWIVGCVILFAIIGAGIMARDSDFVTHVVLHENRNDTNEVNSNDGHVDSLVDGAQRMLRQPIGAGIGSTGSASLFSDSPLIIENQYLFIAHEVGWLGLAVLGVLYFLIMQALWRKRGDWLSLGVLASGFGLALIGMLLPVWADDTVSIVWWGLAAVAIVEKGERREQRTTKQKTA